MATREQRAKTSGKKFRLLIELGAASLLMSVSVSALGQASPTTADGPIERLKPGEYFWAPQIAPAGPVTVIISLTAQRAFAYRNGVPIGVSTISSGKKDHLTPTGVFTVLQKAVKHKSNLYSDAPMPFMQRLTWGGIAMHAGNLPGYPSSHGCVRLPAAFAKLLFGITELGMTVVITDKSAVPVAVSAPAILDKSDATAGAVHTDYAWQPEKSLTGPLSIVVSGQDSRIIVLRNGVEIGSGAISTDGPIMQTAAFTLARVDAKGEHWLRLPLPGQAMVATGELTKAELLQGHLPEGLRQGLASALTPGTTLLVTRASLKSAGTGRRLTVITAGEP